MYTKIKVNGKDVTIDAGELRFFSRCPKCRKEIHVDTFWNIAKDEDFDPSESAIYCSECASETMKERISEMLDMMSQKQLTTLSEFLVKMVMPDTNEVSDIDLILKGFGVGEKI